MENGIPVVIRRIRLRNTLMATMRRYPTILGLVTVTRGQNLRVVMGQQDLREMLRRGPKMLPFFTV